MEDKLLERCGEYAAHFSGLCGVACTVLDAAERTFRFSSASPRFCQGCSHPRCQESHTHLYGSSEAYRWNGSYVYYCPMGLVFAASSISCEQGELCGAITGAILTLGMLTPVDPQDPVGSKRRTGALAKEFQKRFQEKFGDLRCKPLLKAGIQATDATPVARDMALTNRCDVLIITAMEIVEEMRGENA